MGLKAFSVQEGLGAAAQPLAPAGVALCSPGRGGRVPGEDAAPRLYPQLAGCRDGVRAPQEHWLVTVGGRVAFAPRSSCLAPCARGWPVGSAAGSLVPGGLVPAGGSGWRGVLALGRGSVFWGRPDAQRCSCSL